MEQTKINTNETEFKIIKDKKDELQAKIDYVKKRIQTETFKKMVGDGEVVSFRQFYKDIRKGKDFTGKTIVWCSKDGKSGVFVNLWLNNNIVGKRLRTFLRLRIKGLANCFFKCLWRSWAYIYHFVVYNYGWRTPYLIFFIKIGMNIEFWKSAIEPGTFIIILRGYIILYIGL